MCFAEMDYTSIIGPVKLSKMLCGRLFIVWLVLCWAQYVKANVDDTLLTGKHVNKILRINNIVIRGNKTTHHFIMLREMDCHSGDTVTEKNLDALIERNRTRLLNMQLFSMVDMVALYLPWNDTLIDLQINVREVLYWLPKPIFSLADRNFNVWWVEQERALNRTNIGFELTRVNFRGRDERINLLVQLGYNKLFNLAYRVPYVNKAMTLGLNAGVTWGTGRETFYQTQDNKLLFYSNNLYPYQHWQARVGASYRGDYATVHDWQLSLNHNQITDSLFVLNPNYLIGQKKLNWTELMYSWQFNRTNARVYPTQGLEWKGKVLLRQSVSGPSVSQLQWYNEATWYKSLSRRWSWAIHGRARWSIGRNIPYLLNRALGFQAGYVRGYEYYVVDGTHYALLRNGFRYRIIDKVLKQRVVPIMTYIPFRVYAKAFNDMAWVQAAPNTNQTLNNRLLNGYGLGIDILISYYARLRIEYSFNHFGENDLFLHAIKE